MPGKGHNGNGIYVVSDELPLDTWVHVAATAHGIDFVGNKELKLFINGKLAKCTPYPHELVGDPGGNWLIGEWADERRRRQLKGKLKHIKLFTEPLDYGAICDLAHELPLYSKHIDVVSVNHGGTKKSPIQTSGKYFNLCLDDKNFYLHKIFLPLS